MDAFESLRIPSRAQPRIATLRALLSVPDDIALFYAFGAPAGGERGTDGPRSNVLLLDARVEDWWQDYKHDRARYRDDPVRRQLRRSIAPVLWNQLVPGGQIERSDDALWEPVRRHGIRAGLSVPLLDPQRGLHGSLAFVGFCRPQLFDEWWQDMALQVVGATHLFHQGLVDRDIARHQAQLSKREGQCLMRVARGMSSKEIARDLALSPRTVDLHVARAGKRLRAANRIEAVTIAMRNGQIDPQQ